MTEAELVFALAGLLSGERVLGGEAVRRAYDCDAYTVDRSLPSCVVFPESTEDVRSVVRWCLAHSVPYTPRGAGTGLSGGSMPALGGVVLSTKRMTRILETDVEDRCLRVQSGAVNLKVSESVRPFGLHFAPDPSSQSVCTVGGNISENSGGPHTLKYGVTAQHVLALTLVGPDGEVSELGSRVPGQPWSDLIDVVIGAEGTLGTVTEAWIKLTPLPDEVRTALFGFRDPRSATEAVSAVIASGVLPAALEIMDSRILVALKAAFGLEFPSTVDTLLLVECDGPVGVAEAQMAEVRAVCAAMRAEFEQLAADDAERAKLWTARKKGIGAMGRLAPTIVTHDGVIPRSKLPEMLDFVYRVADEAGIGVANIFHAGDGNLHPCFYFDDRVEGAVDRVVAAGETILSKCLELGGSVTGEHGVGVEKAGLWASSLSPGSLALQHAVREVFDVNDLCNPCKLFPDQKGCIEHRSRWRGAAT
ncbi:MAG: FAD-binding protein [Armatimonadetes bacterium]|nr:FAD-binding protein [Armatimonadota bacterium]